MISVFYVTDKTILDEKTWLFNTTLFSGSAPHLDQSNRPCNKTLAAARRGGQSDRFASISAWASRNRKLPHCTNRSRCYQRSRRTRNGTLLPHWFSFFREEFLAAIPGLITWFWSSWSSLRSFTHWPSASQLTASWEILLDWNVTDSRRNNYFTAPISIWWTTVFCETWWVKS